MRQKLNFLEGVCPWYWHKSITAFQKKIIIPTVQYGGGSVIIWGRFAASGPRRLAVVNGTMNSAVYLNILKENIRPSVCDLQLKHAWVRQQDNDPKHTSKSTSELLKKTKWRLCYGLVKVLTWIPLRCCTCSTALQCGWITIILQSWVGQHSYTAL